MPSLREYVTANGQIMVFGNVLGMTASGTFRNCRLGPLTPGKPTFAKKVKFGGYGAPGEISYDSLWRNFVADQVLQVSVVSGPRNHL